MKQILFVGFGGFLGAIGRYKLGGIILHQSIGWRFPLSTFCVNVIGCFVLGALAGFGERQGALSAETRLFLFTGVLGGFTTFSAFGVEGVNLLRRGEMWVAILYAGFSVACGFAAVWAGLKLFGTALRIE